MDCIKEYQVKVMGMSNSELDIPKNFIICVLAATMDKSTGNWILTMSIISYRTSAHKIGVFNNAFPQGSEEINLGEDEPTTKLSDTVGAQMVILLDKAYGVGNYIEIS